MSGFCRLEVRERFGAGLLKPVRDFAEIWFTENHQAMFHDPLAAAVIFDGAICRFIPGIVEVELQSAALRGMTIGTPNAEEARHEFALSVDKERFFEHFFGVFE